MSNGTEIITDPETGEHIESTPQDKKRARRRFDRAKESLITLAFRIKQIADDKDWLHLGYESFEQAVYEELGYRKSQSYKYMTIAMVSESLFGQNENFQFTGKLEENGFSESTGKDWTNKMRIFLELLRDIKIENAYILTKAIEDEKLDGKALYEGDIVQTPSGEPVSQDALRKASRDQLKKWLHPPAESPVKEPGIPNPVKEMKAHFRRVLHSLKDMRQQNSSLVMTENTLDQCSAERIEVYEFMKEFARDFVNPDCYKINERDLKLSPGDFVPCSEIAKAIGVSERTVQRRIDDGQIPAPYVRSTRRRGRLVWRIHPDGLEPGDRHKYYAELTSSAEHDQAKKNELAQKQRQLILNSLTEKGRSRALNLELCLQQYGHLSGEELETALEKHNSEHPGEKPVTLKTFYRKQKEYAKKGFAGVADLRGLHRRGETKVNESDYEYFAAAYLTENRKTAVLCWEETLGRAKKEGRITPIAGKPYEIDLDSGELLGTFPVVKTFERLVIDRVGEAGVALKRLGPHRFKQTIHYPHVTLERETRLPGDIYVMDHHTFDVFCQPSDRTLVRDLLNKILYHKLSKDEIRQSSVTLQRVLKSGLSRKKHVRLWLTNCMDFRTNKQLAWFLHEDAPNSDHVMLVFKWACQKYGYPDVLMMDNGKDFLAYDVRGKKAVPVHRSDVYDDIKIQGVLSNIPTKAHYVLPRESQAKPIERQYQHIIDLFARQWPTYTGKDPKHLPEQTKANIKKGHIPTALEVIEAFDKFVEDILNRKAQKQSKVTGGKPPNQLWDELRPQKEIQAVTAAAAQLMTIRATRPRQLYGNGFKMDLMGGHFYYAQWMDGLSSTKEKYYARWDPYEWEQVFIYRARDNKPMGWARLEKMSPAFASNAQESARVNDAMAEKKRRQKNIKATGRQFRKIAAGVGLENLEAAVDLQNVIYEQVHEVRKDGLQPVRLVQSKLDEIARNMEDSYEARAKKKQKQDFSDITPDKPEPERKIITFDDPEWYE